MYQPAIDFSATLGGKEGNDIVDGLQATLTPKAATIKPGEDIPIEVTLHLANTGNPKPDQFGVAPASVFIWPATSLDIGRNNHRLLRDHADGKTTLLQTAPFYAGSTGQPGCAEITAKQPL